MIPLLQTSEGGCFAYGFVGVNIEAVLQWHALQSSGLYKYFNRLTGKPQGASIDLEIGRKREDWWLDTDDWHPAVRRTVQREESREDMHESRLDEEMRPGAVNMRKKKDIYIFIDPHGEIIFCIWSIFSY